MRVWAFIDKDACSCTYSAITYKDAYSKKEDFPAVAQQFFVPGVDVEFAPIVCYLNIPSKVKHFGAPLLLESWSDMYNHIKFDPRQDNLFELWVDDADILAAYYDNEDGKTQTVTHGNYKYFKDSNSDKYVMCLIQELDRDWITAIYSFTCCGAFACDPIRVSPLYTSDKRPSSFFGPFCMDANKNMYECLLGGYHKMPEDYMKEFQKRYGMHGVFKDMTIEEALSCCCEDTCKALTSLATAQFIYESDYGKVTVADMLASGDDVVFHI